MKSVTTLENEHLEVTCTMTVGADGANGVIQAVSKHGITPAVGKDRLDVRENWSYRAFARDVGSVAAWMAENPNGTLDHFLWFTREILVR